MRVQDGEPQLGASLEVVGRLRALRDFYTAADNEGTELSAFPLLPFMQVTVSGPVLMLVPHQLVHLIWCSWGDCMPIHKPRDRVGSCMGLPQKKAHKSADDLVGRPRRWRNEHRQLWLRRG